MMVCVSHTTVTCFKRYNNPGDAGHTNICALDRADAILLFCPRQLLIWKQVLMKAAQPTSHIQVNVVCDISSTPYTLNDKHNRVPKPGRQQPPGSGPSRWALYTAWRGSKLRPCCCLWLSWSLASLSQQHKRCGRQCNVLSLLLCRGGRCRMPASHLISAVWV